MEKYRNGRECFDNTPVALPVGYRPPEPLSDMIRRLVRVESIRAVQQGMESFEEADDFEVPDAEPEFKTDHQMTDMEEDLPAFNEKAQVHDPAEKAAAQRRQDEQRKGKEEIESKNRAVARSKEEVDELEQ